MVDVWFPYGKTDVCVRVPARNLLGSINPVQKSGVSDNRAEIDRALKEPIGTRQLTELVKPEGKVAIAIDDALCNDVYNDMILSVLAELNATGIKDENVTLIFSYDNNGVVKSEDAALFLDEEVLNRVNIVKHDVRAGDLVYAGTTKSYGNKVFLNRVFAEADVKILLGEVYLHYYAGYEGGRKTVLTKVSGEETIQHNSVMMLNSNAKAGILNGNPIHEDMTEVARLAKVDFIVNVVRNSKGEVVQAFAGDLEAAFLEAVKLVDEIYKVKVDRRADIVVVSAGGNPLDATLDRAYRAVDNALDVVKRGGVIILVAECPEGYGNQMFYDWMTRLVDLKSTEKEIKRNFATGGHKAYYLLKTLQSHPVILVSALPDYYAINVFKLKTARAVNDALTDAFKAAGSAARVWTIPFGNYTLPEYSAPEEIKT
ncbi:MAG: nickel-dependent lactate racemase [Nitrososphaerota archaeon]|jgi:nickel-dependent lactate racemase|nr:nickel-dependent lactate racemase [Nitrososphaerota archaeon]